MSQNVVWQKTEILKADRALIKGQKPCVIWFTGLSGSGKSTIANAVDVVLHERGYHTFLLDGDNVRHGLCSDLGFSNDERIENIRRIGEVSKLFCDAGLIVLSAFISPFIGDREMVRRLFGKGEFIEVYMDAPLSVCEGRDPKGLYSKARSGEIKDFTGIDSPYERPPEPEVRLNTSVHTVDQCVERLLQYMVRVGLVSAVG